MPKRSRPRPRRPRAGSSPGTLVAASPTLTSPIRVIRYTETEVEEHFFDSVQACRPQLERPGVCWIDFDRAPDASTLEALRRLLDLHPLAVADAANVPQRPKYESYPTFDFLVLRMPQGGVSTSTEQLSLFLGERWVLTVQEVAGDCFEPVRERLRAGLTGIRNHGADYLAYALVDAVIDGYFPVVEHLFDQLEVLEVDMTSSADRKLLRRLHDVRRELLHMRRAIWPMREALMQLTREGGGRFQPQTRLYLRDCYDHSVQLLDLVETSREMATSLVDLHLSLVGFRTNDVMKVLTIISTIFLPLSFIAGVYGMNFDMRSPLNMPELQWEFGYLFALGLMALCALGMLVFFRKRGWLGDVEDGLESLPRD